MTKRQYIAGLSIQSNFDMKKIIKELNKAFSNINFKYRKCDEFPSYIAEYSGVRIELLEIPCVENNVAGINRSETLLGEKLDEYSVSFQADESYIIKNIPELHKSLPVALNEAAVGGFEITSYLRRFIKTKCLLHIEPDPWPIK